MKNSGYVAIGHLIGGKSKEEIVKTLKHFISVMFKALDDNMINKVDFEWNLDKFMEKIPKGKKLFRNKNATCSINLEWSFCF